MAEKHRTFSSRFKFRVVMELLTGAKRPAEVCREHQIADSVLSRWRQKLLAPFTVNTQAIFGETRRPVPSES